jgi:hypothetical protein
MLRKAKELNDANPGSVSFLDFNGRDFDKAVEIMPARPDRTFWKETFRIALGDLAELVAPSRLVFCEGSQSSVSGTRSGEFDARCLRRIFSGEYPDAEFVSLGSAGEVQKNSLLLSSVFQQVLSAVNVYRVVDKDDRSPSEIQELQRKGFRVLSRRHIESFFFDDEIITKLCQSVGMADKVQDVLAAKAAAVKASVGRGNPSDDYKSMSSELYVQTKRLLNLTQCGNTKDAFCVDTLAPLITPDTAVYRQLKTDIMD